MLYHLIGFPVGETCKKYRESKSYMIYGHDSLSSIKLYNSSVGYKEEWLDRRVIPDNYLDLAMSCVTDDEWFDVLKKVG